MPGVDESSVPPGVLDGVREERPRRSLTAPLIQVSQLRKSYGGTAAPVHALRDVSITIERGEFVAIMGTSGSGKSTLMNILGCLDRPTSGRYLLDGLDVSAASRDELADLRNQKLGFIFQGFNLLSRTTALENVAMPMLCGRRRLSSQAVRRCALQRLEQVGLSDRAAHFANQLSGGQQQRVAIARALINEPEIILADEPTGNLDSKTSLEIMEVFQRLNDSGMTLIMVTHELHLAQFCRRGLVMQDGQLVQDRLVANRPLAKHELSLLARGHHKSPDAGSLQPSAEIANKITVDAGFERAHRE